MASFTASSVGSPPVGSALAVTSAAPEALLPVQGANRLGVGVQPRGDERLAGLDAEGRLDDAPGQLLASSDVHGSDAEPGALRHGEHDLQPAIPRGLARDRRRGVAVAAAAQFVLDAPLLVLEHVLIERRLLQPRDDFGSPLLRQRVAAEDDRDPGPARHPHGHVDLLLALGVL